MAGKVRFYGPAGGFRLLFALPGGRSQDLEFSDKGVLEIDDTPKNRDLIDALETQFALDERYPVTSQPPKES